MDRLIVADGQFSAHITSNSAVLHEAYRLRHTVFAEELEWVPTHPSGTESDSYDAYAVHLVVQNNESVVGYLRMICGGKGGFMLQHEFASLNPIGDAINCADSLEVTR